ACAVPPSRSRPQPRAAHPPVRQAAPRTARSTARATAARTAAPRARAPPRARRPTVAKGESRELLPSSFGRRGRHRSVFEPVRPALAATANRIEVRRLDLARDGPGWADHVVV